MSEEKNIYWIWAPRDDVLIGITEDGYLVSTANVVTQDDIMTTFIVPKSSGQVTDADMQQFENKEVTDEMVFESGKLPNDWIKETYEIIDEYYETIEDYEPTIVPQKPEKMNALAHGPHYIVTPPMIQTDEGAVERIRDLIKKISDRTQEIMIPPQKINELYDKLTEAGLTFFVYDTPKELEGATMYFTCCGFRWAMVVTPYNKLIGLSALDKTRVRIVFSPRNDIDVLMFYKYMKEGKIKIKNLHEFQKEFEETVFIIPPEIDEEELEGMSPEEVSIYIENIKKNLEKKRMKIISKSWDYVEEIYYAINKMNEVWKCALSE